VTVVSSARDRLSAAPFEPVAHDRALDLLSGMAVALGHDADLDFLLAELASGVRRTLDADRVSVLLLDDAGRLSPAVAVARQHNDDLWQRFRKMPPIALDDLPGARQALAQGRVLVIDDASVSPLVPIAWQRTFELGSLAVAPLLVADSPAGLVAVEYGEARAPFTPTQLTLVEGMAALAGIALRAGRQRSQVQRLETECVRQGPLRNRP
jgi:GAF domain-containing protein